MDTIDWLHLISSFLFFVSAAHKLYEHEQHNFYTRAMAGTWFLFTVIFRDFLSVNIVRELSNYFIMLIPSVEIISPLLIRYWRSKK